MLEMVQYRAGPRPFLNILLAQLHDCKIGEYICLVISELEFRPIYQVIPLMPLPNLKDKRLQRQSSMSAKLKEEEEGKSQYRLGLSGGSQIFLKSEIMREVSIQTIKPFLDRLHLHLKIENKGYINCFDDGIKICEEDGAQSIWLGFIAKPMSVYKSISQSKEGECVFRNFSGGMYLCLNASGVLHCCREEESATRFKCERNTPSRSFRLTSSGRKTAMGDFVAIVIDIEELEDSFMTIHYQLSYIKEQMLKFPSIELIGTILHQLLYYQVKEFRKNDSLVNQYIKRVLFEYGITASISQYLLKSFKRRKLQASVSDLELFLSPSDAEMASTLKEVNLLCAGCQDNSVLFLPLLDELVNQSHFQAIQIYIKILTKENHYFISQFYLRGWHTVITAKLLSLHQKSSLQVRIHSNMLRTLILFANYMAQEPNYSFTKYRDSRCSIPNQFLIYETLKRQDFIGHCQFYEIYVEGFYVFLHSAVKGMVSELHTFLEGEGSPTSYSLHERETEGEKIYVQLELILAMSAQCNYNIINSYSSLVVSLLPYCFQDNFPVFKSPKFKQIILRLFLAFNPFLLSWKLKNRFLVATVTVEPIKHLKNDQLLQSSEKCPRPTIRTSLSNHINMTADSFSQPRTQNWLNNSKIMYFLYENFAMKCREWLHIVKKQKNMQMLLAQLKDQNLLEWLKVVRVCLQDRVFKVREKKKAQFIQYIKTLFQSIETDKTRNHNEELLFTDFNEWVLELLSYGRWYSKHCAYLRVRRSYESKKLNQLFVHKVLSNFVTPASFTLFQREREMSKIDRIHLLEKGTQNYDMQETELKIVLTQILILVVANNNEQLLEESIDTLILFVKNPTNFHSFDLIESFPKYAFQSQLKFIALEQFYLASNCALLNNIITLLRMVYEKDLIHLRNLNDMLLLDQSNLLPDFANLSSIVRYLGKMVKCVDSWLQEMLMETFPQPFSSVKRCLETVEILINQLNQKWARMSVLRIMENIQLIEIITEFLPYLTMLSSQATHGSAFSKLLNDYFERIELILQLYIYPVQGELISIRMKYLFLKCGGYLSRRRGSQLLEKVIRNASSDINKLFTLITYEMSSNFLMNLPSSLYYFQALQKISKQQFIKKVEYISTEIEQMEGKAEEALLQQLSSPEKEKDKLSEEEYPYRHQNIFLQIFIRLVDSHLQDLQFFSWLRDKVFMTILVKEIQLNSNRYSSNRLLGVQGIRRRSLLAYAGYRLITIADKEASEELKEIKSQSAASESSCENVQRSPRRRLKIIEIKTMIVNYVYSEVEASKYNKASKQERLSLNSIPDVNQLEYLEYFVLDLLPLAQFIDQIAEDTQFLSIFEANTAALLRQRKNKVTDRNEEDVDEKINLLRALFSGERGSKELKPRAITFNFQDQRGIYRTESFKTTEEKSKPQKKWNKALLKMKEAYKTANEPNNIFFNSVMSFNEIYELREPEDINMVVNRDDIIRKIISVALNMARLDLDLNNRIFILEQTECIILKKIKQSQKYLNDSQNVDIKELREFSTRLLESVFESKGSQLDFSWSEDPLLISFKLRLIAMTRHFQMREENTTELEHLIQLLKLARMNYQQDYNYLELLYEDEKQLFSNSMLLQRLCLPLDIVLMICSEEISAESIPKHYSLQIVQELYKTIGSVQFENRSQIARFSEEDVVKIIKKFEKSIVKKAQKAVERDIFYGNLLATKNDI